MKVLIIFGLIFSLIMSLFCYFTLHSLRAPTIHILLISGILHGSFWRFLFNWPATNKAIVIHVVVTIMTIVPIFMSTIMLSIVYVLSLLILFAINYEDRPVKMCTRLIQFVNSYYLKTYNIRFYPMIYCATILLNTGIIYGFSFC